MNAIAGRSRAVIAVAIAALSLLLCACSAPPLVDSSQVQSEAWHTGAGSVGQTFVARHGGLTAIDLFLSPTASPAGLVTLHLRRDPADVTDLRTQSLPPAAITAPGFHRFQFDPIPDSKGQAYYAAWEADPPGSVQTATAGGLTYLDGSRHVDRQPVDSQAVFRLAYQPGYVLLDLLRTGAVVSGWALLSLAVLGIPGLALLAGAGLIGRDLDLGDVLTAAPALGFALYPVLLVWTGWLGLAAGAWHLWATLGVSLLYLGWHYGHSLPRRSGQDKPPGMHLRRPGWADAPHLTLLAVVALLFFVRMLVISGLEAPSWGDSVQHAVMAQLLVDHGGLFQSWEPYAPYATLTTHFGFPALAALLSWATGATSAPATLVAGQLANVLAVLAIYPLARRFASGNPWAGVFAVLVAGLVSLYPAYYVNWGRYAQLAGQAILPVALWLLWRAAEAPRIDWRLAAVAGLAACGMTLAYYRAPYYYASFVVGWFLLWAIPTWGRNVRAWRVGIGQIALAAAFSLAFFMPWLVTLAGSRLASWATFQPESEAAVAQHEQYRRTVVDRVVGEFRVWQMLPTYVPLPLQFLAIVALVWGLVRRRFILLILPLWVLSMAALIAGQLVDLPGSSFMQTFAILIALYIPVAILIGWLAADLVARFQQRFGAARASLFAGATVLLAAFAFLPRQITIVDSQFIMVTRPDMQAMAWIASQTPEDAQFLVEGFTIYGGTQAVGADAGWWIPLLAGRANTMPPQYAMANEQPLEPGYTQQVVDLVATLEEFGVSSPAAKAALCESGVTHVYIGQRQGQVGAGVNQLFSPEELAGDPTFDRIYHRDLVHIYQFDRAGCTDHRG